MEYAYTLIGMVTAYLVAFALAVMLALVIVGLALRYWPRIHVGPPRNPLHWICYDARVIEKPRVIHDFGIRWWVGLSSRRKVSWFFGFLKVSDTDKD